MKNFSAQSFPIPFIHTSARRALVAFFFALAIGLAAQIRIPLPGTPVPMTLQTLALFIGAALLGRHYATQMAAWYVGLGAIGLPMFAGGAAGAGVLIGATGGYLIGFIAAATFIGYLQPHVRTIVTQLGLFFAASLIIFLCGASWLAIALHLTAQQAIGLGVLPFVAGDLLKITLACAAIRGQKKLFSLF